MKQREKINKFKLWKDVINYIFKEYVCPRCVIYDGEKSECSLYKTDLKKCTKYDNLCQWLESEVDVKTKKSKREDFIEFVSKFKDLKDFNSSDYCNKILLDIKNIKEKDFDTIKEFILKLATKDGGK